MNRNNMSRLVPIALVLIVIAIAIAALVSVGRALFSGDSETSGVTDTSQKALVNTNADRAVSMIVRGPIVANEDFRSYQITVTPSDRTITTYQGYLGQQLGTDRLGNNTKAYEEFVYALDRANMMAGKVPVVNENNDTRGICATGKVYEFEILSSYQVEKSLWTSTCKGSAGSLKASVSQLQSLFLEQIPSAQQKLIKDAKL